jgi:hypothetical protein
VEKVRQNSGSTPILMNYGEGIMRSLWELVISTAVPSNQQAEFGMAWPQKRAKSKM